jgi:hypothetical protein
MEPEYDGLALQAMRDAEHEERDWSLPTLPRAMALSGFAELLLTGISSVELVDELRGTQRLL